LVSSNATTSKAATSAAAFPGFALFQRPTSQILLSR
jgi:hypothetical protein